MLPNPQTCSLINAIRHIREWQDRSTKRLSRVILLDHSLAPRDEILMPVKHCSVGGQGAVYKPDLGDAEDLELGLGEAGVGHLECQGVADLGIRVQGKDVTV